MTLAPRVILSSLAGLMLGGAILFLILMAAIAFAVTTGGEVSIPGIFQAWFTTENGLPAMNFQPNFVGMLLVILFVAIVYVSISLRFLGRTRGHGFDE